MPVADLILKLYAFDIFLFEFISLTEDKMVPVCVPCKSTRKDKEFEYNCLRIYRYLSLVK